MLYFCLGYSVITYKQELMSRKNIVVWQKNILTVSSIFYIMS